jgi:hypothetical protein
VPTYSGSGRRLWVQTPIPPKNQPTNQTNKPRTTTTKAYVIKTQPDSTSLFNFVYGVKEKLETGFIQ